MTEPVQMRQKGEPDPVKSPDKSIKGVRTLADLRSEGYRPFSISLLHAYAGVDFDIVARFAEESKETVRSMAINFPFPLFSVDSEWTRLLHIINEDVWETFRAFMMGVVFANTPEQEYWKATPALGTLQDPFARMTNPTEEPERCSLDVLLPIGNKRSLGIIPHTIEVEDAEAPVRIVQIPTSITLQWGPPDPRVVEEAKAVFSTGDLQ